MNQQEFFKKVVDRIPWYQKRLPWYFILLSFVLIVVFVHRHIHEKETIRNIDVKGKQALLENEVRPITGVDTTDVWKQAVSKDMQSHLYRFDTSTNGELFSSNHHQGYESKVTKHGSYSVIPKKGSDFSIAISEVNYTTSQKERRSLARRKNPAIHFHLNEAEVHHGTHWYEQYVNSSEGLRQNIILAEPLDTAIETVQIQFKTKGIDSKALLPDSTGVILTSESQRYYYRDLNVWDVSGRKLPAYMMLTQQGFSIQASVTNALYPITIDPVLSMVSTLIIESNQPSAMYGNSVASAGDVNGDGYDDVIIGASEFENGQNDEGAAFVYLGSKSGLKTKASWKFESNQPNAYLGYSVSSAGDVNDDGFDDVIIGAPFFESGESDEGAVFIFLGGLNGLSTSPDLILESNTAGAQFGNSVSSLGDINDDGFDDFIIGAYRYSNGQRNEGAAFVYLGRRLIITTEPSKIIESNQEGAQLGHSVSSAGDVNGDGFCDIIIGAPYFDYDQTNEGAAFIFFGCKKGVLSEIVDTLHCNQEYACFGNAVSTAGDVNGDGFDDILISATNYMHQTSSSVVFVYYGRGDKRNIYSRITDTLRNSQESDCFGGSISTAGDLNSDGFDDIIVGAGRYSNNEFNEGAIYIFFGNSDGLQTKNSYKVESNSTSAEFGCSVKSAGDINNDGFNDLVVGAQKYQNEHVKEGAVYIYEGDEFVGNMCQGSLEWSRQNCFTDSVFMDTNLPRSVVSGIMTSGEKFLVFDNYLTRPSSYIHKKGYNHVYSVAYIQANSLIELNDTLYTKLTELLGDKGNYVDTLCVEQLLDNSSGLSDSMNIVIYVIPFSLINYVKALPNN